MSLLCLPLLIAAALQLGAGEPALHAIAVSADGELSQLTREQLHGDASLPDADHYWVWNDESAATKLSREKLAAVVSGSEPIEPARRCVLRFSPWRKEIDAGLVRVAPVEMWAEVPEGLIPTFTLPKSPPFTVPVPLRESVRLRVSMNGEGSSWIDVPARASEISVPLSRTRDHTLKVVDDDGHSIADVQLSILANQSRDERYLARLVGGDDGVVAMHAFPLHADFGLVVSQKSHASFTLHGSVGQLPDRVTLPKGAILKGLLVDGEKKPVAGASVVVEAWISDNASALFRKESRSDEHGKWRIDQVPMRRAVLVVRHVGFATTRTELEVDHPAVDLGRQILSPGVEVTLKAVDDRGQPIADATVQLEGDEIDLTTDRKGLCSLRGVDALAELRGRVAASGHLDTKFSLRPPFDRPVFEVVVPRGFEVAGRFVDADSVPIDDGRVRVQTGNSYRVEELESKGRFRLTLAPGVDHELTFISPGTGQTLLRVSQGSAGERRDLGDVRPVPGGTVRGRLVSVEQPDGIAGATIWTPRPAGAGALLAWLDGNIASARCDDTGSFELRGVPYAPLTLRADAPGYARRFIDLTLVADQPPADLGVVTLERGVDLEVLAAGAPDGAIATLDLRGEWLDLDMLTSQLSEGVARFDAVGPGEVIVTVKSGRDVVCESRITIPADVRSYRADCQAETTTVDGRVTLGGRPAGAGTITFASAVAVGPAAIISSVSPSGSVRQETYGTGSPSRTASVDALGEFRLTGMRAGEWRATWQAEGSGPSPPRSVTIPDVRTIEVTLDFPAGGISGRVVDVDRNPVPRARVLELDGGAAALAGPDGTFRLGGLAPGRIRLQARLGERESDIVETIVEPDRDGAVELVLRNGGANELRVRILDASGQPAAGAMLFVDGFGSYLRIVTADGEGLATTTFSTAFPSSVRLAAFHRGGWFLTGAMRGDDARNGYVARLEPQGTVRVTLDDGGPLPVRITAPGGWELGNLLVTLGLRPNVAKATPLVLQVPQGEYEITAGTLAKRARVESGRDTVVAFEAP